MIRTFLSAFILLLSLLTAYSVHAHELSVAHVDIDASETTNPGRKDLIRLELDLALRDIALSLPLDGNRDERVTWGELVKTRPSLEAMATAGLSLSSISGPCELTPKTLALRRYDSGAYAVLGIDARCPSRSGLRLGYNLLFDNDPQHQAIVTMRDGSTTTSAVMNNGRRVAAFAPGSRQPFTDFLLQGIHHILIGYDHLAFLLSLLLPAALVRREGRWHPQEKPRACFMQILGIVTAFTLAHSITLSLAALGWVVPASRWVEALIAGSVLLAALNNVWPQVTRRLWVVGCLFGLIHGFGFAGALSELGLPEDGRLLLLLAFNLGVEAGQIAVVCAVLPVLFLLREKRWYSQRLMPLLSLGIAAMAMVWLWQRLMPS